MSFSFTPKKMPSITVDFGYIPGQTQTWHDPGCLPEVEIFGVQIRNMEIDGELESHLIETFGDEWESDIIKNSEIKYLNQTYKR